MEYDCENIRHAAQNAGKAMLYGLSPCDQRVGQGASGQTVTEALFHMVISGLLGPPQKCEKLTMSIACNILSAPFHEPVSPLVSLSLDPSKNKQQTKVILKLIHALTDPNLPEIIGLVTVM